MVLSRSLGTAGSPVVTECLMSAFTPQCSHLAFALPFYIYRLVFLLLSIISMGWTQHCLFHPGVKAIRAFEVCQALAEGKTLVLIRPGVLSEKEKTDCSERKGEGCFVTAHISATWWHICIVSANSLKVSHGSGPGVSSGSIVHQHQKQTLFSNLLSTLD